MSDEDDIAAARAARTAQRNEAVRLWKEEQDRQPLTITWRGHTLRYDRGGASYCLGGYCDAVWVRVSRLKGNDGSVVATISIVVGEGKYDYSSFNAAGPTMEAACEASYQKAVKYHADMSSLLAKLGEG